MSKLMKVAEVDVNVRLEVYDDKTVARATWVGLRGQVYEESVTYQDAHWTNWEAAADKAIGKSRGAIRKLLRQTVADVNAQRKVEI